MFGCEPGTGACGALQTELACVSEYRQTAVVKVEGLTTAGFARYCGLERPGSYQVSRVVPRS
jgi:hypothetical protein